MSNITESFEDTYKRCTESGFTRVLAQLEEQLITLRNPRKVQLLKDRIEYIKMRGLLDD